MVASKSPPPGKVRVGISGWRYPPWRGVFYPKGLTQAGELAFASRALPTIEINGSFYSLQRPENYAAWYADTPDDFVFAVKGNRFITHIKRLRESEKPLANVLASGMLHLGEKLGPMLWQLPPTFKYDAGVIGDFLALLPHDTGAALALARKRQARMHGRSRLAIDAVRPLRHAMEVRHASFANPEFIGLLRQHNVALVVADTAGKWPYFDDVTADFMYMRLHGEKKLYASGYTDSALDMWAERIRGWSARGDVYCYFDNDVKTRAPFDARRLMEKLGIGQGLTPLPDKRRRPTVPPARNPYSPPLT